MSKNVIWTQDERTALAAATLNLLSNAAQMPVAGMNSADVQKQVQRYGFFSGVFRQAQRYVFAATPERVRTIITHTQVPWLMEEIYSRMREVHVADMIAAQEKARSAAQAAAAKEKSVLEAVSLTLTASPDGLHKLADALAPLLVERVVTMLAERYHMTPKQMRSVMADTSSITMSRRPVVYLLGPKANQAEDINRAWGTRFELRVIHDRVGLVVPAPMPNTYVIGMADFLSHQLERKFKSAGHNYRAVHGGVTSIKKALNDLYAKINNPAAQKAATV